MRNILLRVQLRARRQMLLKKMNAQERNAYLQLAALDREVSHVTDVIDGARGNGYLVRFRALETEHIIQAWRSTGRRGKPVVTGDSDEDDPRVLPGHSPIPTPVRSLETFRKDRDGGDSKSKTAINRFRHTLGVTGGKSTNADDNKDDGTLGDPVKLVEEMITTGTLWGQSSLGQGGKGAYRARQDVLNELIEHENERLKSHEGFRTRRKRRYMRMLNYMKNKLGSTTSSGDNNGGVDNNGGGDSGNDEDGHGDRSGTRTSAGARERMSLLKQFADEFSIPDEELDEFDMLDAARTDVYNSMKSDQIRSSHRSMRKNKNMSDEQYQNSLHGSSRGIVAYNSSTHNRAGRSTSPSSPLSSSQHNNNTNNNLLSQASDGSDRWRLSRRDGGVMNNVLNGIEDTVTTNRKDSLALQRLGVTEDQINLMRIQSLRQRGTQAPPSDLAYYLMSPESGLRKSKTPAQQHLQVKRSMNDAVDQMRDDLLYGRNNSDLWFGANGVMWIPTPGADVSPEMKEKSRDMALKKAMTMFMSIGALKDQKEEEEQERRKRKEEQEKQNNNKRKKKKSSRRIAGAGGGASAADGGVDPSSMGDYHESGFYEEDEEYNEDEEEVDDDEGNENNKNANEIMYDKLSQQPQTFIVREASVRRGGGNNNDNGGADSSFVTSTINPPMKSANSSNKRVTTSSTVVSNSGATEEGGDDVFNE